MLFDTFDAGDLNKELKSLMDGLSVKVRGPETIVTQQLCVATMKAHGE